MSKLKNFTPLGGRIILKFKEDQEEAYGNIVLPKLGDDFVYTAEVIKTSNSYNFNTDTIIPSPVKEGDIVLVTKMGCHAITIENEEYYATDFNTIVGILNK